ncbi:xanthine dehydrogenase molybdopterin binding subunit [Albidovulum sediminicola]|uniref:Xanthine dehydrogenase molybdopterin binding subunit n=1 Tax=Albidovulum sediminicola TaxID=2984331 RepID=A0ABT2Z4U5_9RHOB|nr:xanthine dehydrogenase molybdopterin binding subunit [Defluviimonas sp. WL0075]MCV2866168.1 xanthine dehydrogenase molybdopterin binding subunit [Defluviimonas sp. WL0075]
MSVAKPVPHDSAELHVTGAARYIDDVALPANALHLAFGLSSAAHGDITAMDLSAVKAAPGVVAVWTAEDLPFANDVSPSAHDEPLLATGTVHYVGQPIFLVVAESHLQARKAARKARIDYREKPAILTVDQALAADSRFEGGPVVWSKGDAATAIAGAPQVIEGSFTMGGQEHFYLEGQAALALPAEGGVIVQSSTQHPTEIQHKVAEALGLPMNAVRVEIRRMGGGFGGKESQGNALAVSCALVARLLGRPAKMRYDRDDDMTITGKRHDFRIDYRVGVDAGGKIQGIEFLQLARCGWSMDLSLPVADRAMLHADNAYNLDHVRIESHRLRTNTQSATAYRGFGGPQGMIGIERVMDHIAHAMGLAPTEVRKRNFYAEMPGALPPDPRSTSARMKGGRVDLTSEGAEGFVPDGSAGLTQTTPYHMPVEDFILNGLVARLEAEAGLAARRDEITAWNRQSPILKRGIALTPVKFGISFTLTHLNQAGALVHVYQDGSIHLNHGGTEMGQGLFRKVSQVAAAAFGVDVDAVMITATDTAKVPNTSATAASSGSDLNGMAVKDACDRIRARMAEYLAQQHQSAPAAVRFEGGRVLVGGEDMSFAEAAARCYMGRVSLSQTGFYATPKITWDRKAGRGRPFYYFSYGASVSEVVIDTLTGENRILRTDILHDAGASLNPAIDIGQVEGAYVQGAGWLTTEELVWDEKGRLRTHAPSTYKIPACSDRPRVFNVALYDGANREETIYRSKAVGEPPFMHGISVFMALSQACAACGPHYPDLQAPATAEAVLAAVKRARGLA